jgi:arylsulfatase A-like enzyme
MTACGKKDESAEGGASRQSAQKDSPQTARKKHRGGSAGKKTAKGPTLPSGYRPHYDLIQNRAGAYFYQHGGLIVRCGGVGFAKFSDGGWKNPWILNQRIQISASDLTKQVPQIPKPTVVGGARVQGLVGTLILPVHWDVFGIGESAAGGLVLEVILHNRVRGQYVTPMVNGETLHSVRIRQGLDRIRIPIAQKLIRRGDNVFRFVFRKSATVRNVQAVGEIVAGRGRRKPGPHSRSAATFLVVGLGKKEFKIPAQPDFVACPARPLTFADRTQKGFSLSGPAKYSHFLIPPPGAKLQIQLASNPIPAAGAKKRKTRYQIRAAADNGATRMLAQGTLSPDWQRVLVDLSAYAQRAVRLDIVSPDSGIRLAEAKLFAKPSRKPFSWTQKPIDYVFIWLADTLRRDHVGAHGAKNAHTPNFDKFAERAVVFEQATIQGNHSMTSHGSLLTGYYPPVHGFERANRRLRKPLIYQRFKKAGWRTAMFSSNGYISTKWGFKRGLDEYRNFIRESKANSTKYLWGTAKRYLKKHIKDRVFVYLATIDPHVTYDPPTKYLKLHSPKPYRGPVPRRATGRFLEKLITGAIKLEDPKDRRRLEALYKGEVSYNDAWFGHFLADLKKLGIADRSLVVMVSDHGDQFWEHGSVGHGKSLYEEEIAVPLMFWWPGLPRQGVRILGDVEAMDMFATILELAAVAPDKKAQTASLLPLVKSTAPRAMTCAFAYNYEKSRSLRMGRYKLIIRRPDRIKVFDLKTDPTEQKNLHAKAPVATRLLRTTFGLKNAYLEGWQKSRWGTACRLEKAFYTDVSPKQKAVPKKGSTPKSPPRERPKGRSDEKPAS